MPVLALLLVLASAISHPLWNLLLKRSQDKLIYSWLLWIAAGAVLVPFAIWGALSEPVYATVGWCVLGTSLAFVAYAALLARSYTRGDISLVYPISRGVGPLGTTVFALLFLSEQLTPSGIAGVLLVVVAVVGISWPGKVSSPASEKAVSRGGPRAAVLPAVGVGLAIATYSIIDKIGVTLASPLLYFAMTSFGGGLLMGPLVLWRRGGEAIGQEIARSRWALLAGGALMAGSYLLTLFAFRLAPVSYCITVRSTSVLFAILLGSQVLGEARGLQRGLLAGAVVAGLALIALAG